MSCWSRATLPRWIGIAADQLSGKVFSQRGRHAVKLLQRSSLKDGERCDVRERDNDGLFEGFKRGYENDYEYEIAGKTVTCSHCGSTTSTNVKAK